jgi:hypothetical protein
VQPTYSGPDIALGVLLAAVVCMGGPGYLAVLFGEAVCIFVQPVQWLQPEGADIFLVLAYNRALAVCPCPAAYTSGYTVHLSRPEWWFKLLVVGMAVPLYGLPKGLQLFVPAYLYIGP